MTDQNFPALIAELETLGLRVEDIASKTGASAAAVYRWKRGSKPMGVYQERVEALLTRERRKASALNAPKNGEE